MTRKYNHSGKAKTHTNKRTTEGEELTLPPSRAEEQTRRCDLSLRDSYNNQIKSLIVAMKFVQKFYGDKGLSQI
ncbi:hypothetical protein ACE6H2_024693 [Prunus campanulata]